MSQTLCIVAFTLCAQLPGSGRLPYAIEYNDGTPYEYVFISPSDIARWERLGSVTVELAAPWLPPNERDKRVVMSKLTGKPQQVNATLYRLYLDQGWEDHDGVQVTTATGETQWVHSAEDELHKRSLALYADAFPPRTELTMPPPAPEATKRISFFAEWGLHLAIAGMGIVLASLTTWLVFIRQSWGAVKT